jgi:hypothetical protein
MQKYRADGVCQLAKVVSCTPRVRNRQLYRTLIGRDVPTMKMSFEIEHVRHQSR